MQVRAVEDAAEFLQLADPLLEADEARHNLILGLATTIRDHPRLYPDRRFWVASRTAPCGPSAS